jgi:hypoxanthine-DNA glycosylase
VTRLRETAVQDELSPQLVGFAPVADVGARLLVLGSFPSVASLAAGQYYAHPRNQFWTILSALWGVDLRAMPYGLRLIELRERGLALWDVYAACRRQGSLDSAIELAQANDLAGLVATLPALRGIAHNGGESARSIGITRALGLPVIRLPSTSPANASWTYERKRQAWADTLASCGIAVRAAAAESAKGASAAAVAESGAGVGADRDS